MLSHLDGIYSGSLDNWALDCMVAPALNRLFKTPIFCAEGSTIHLIYYRSPTDTSSDAID
jgi:hypothetical protein